MNKSSRFSWQWQLECSPSQLWPYISDTNRFNYDLNLPAITSRPVPGTAQRQNRLAAGPFILEWVETPFEWKYPHSFRVRRKYRKGPVEELVIQVTCEARQSGGTLLTYETEVRARGFWGGWLVAFQMKAARKKFSRVFQHYDRLARQKETLRLSKQPFLSEAARKHLRQKLRQVTVSAGTKGLRGKTEDLVCRADEMTLALIRPFELADLWKYPRRQVLEFFLQATRSGIFDLSWRILCPFCRGSEEDHSSIRELKEKAHCRSCGIDYSVNFDQFVEVTFRPSRAIRRVGDTVFCTGNPQKTPHILLQSSIPPGGTLTQELQLEPGRYRLRCLRMSGAAGLELVRGGPQETQVTLKGGAVECGETTLSPEGTLCIGNASEEELIFMMERMAWGDTSATGRDVMTLQTFRDLFSAEVLRPDQRISVGSLCLIFTDLKDSTRMYRLSGDARAFGTVMDHFDILKKHISDHGGSLVKTIGDAVMAVFIHPREGLEAVLKAQRELAALNPALYLKAGLHYGPLIAVTLNGRLDYFGTTANVAARLCSLSGGGDIIFSSGMQEDPGVRELLAREGRDPEAFETELKGFDAPFELFRLRGRRIPGRS